MSPSQGYIDAIEARLHQTEALLGIMLSSNDERALTLLRDIAQVRFIAVALLGLVSAQCHLTKYRLVRH